jgi:hypothetical protein
MRYPTLVGKFCDCKRDKGHIPPVGLLLEMDNRLCGFVFAIKSTIRVNIERNCSFPCPHCSSWITIFNTLIYFAGKQHQSTYL